MILDTAESFLEVSRAGSSKKCHAPGKDDLAISLSKPATRTRTSFEIAGKRLSADTINIFRISKHAWSRGKPWRTRREIWKP
jgi:aspartate carbamoyltransferase catalytic subunit